MHPFRAAFSVLLFISLVASGCSDAETIKPLPDVGADILGDEVSYPDSIAGEVHVDKDLGGEAATPDTEADGEIASLELLMEKGKISYWVRS